MNPRIKELWLQALRSNMYKQGQGVLRREGDKYCCLGVLCDLYLKEHNEVWRTHITNSNVLTYWIGEDDALLPDKVRKWAGLEKRNPRVKTNTGMSTLAQENDNGVPFRIIAEFIDRWL